MQMRRLVLPATVALTLATASPALARNFFVSAGSTGAGTCDAPTPSNDCQLEYVLSPGVASPGDDVTMAPGTYVLHQMLDIPVRVVLHGTPGQPRPVISLSDPNSFAAVNIIPFGTVLRHLEFTSSLVTETTLSLHDTTVEDSIIHATSPGTSAVVVDDGSALRNTVLRMDGTAVNGAVALRGSQELRNVTISGVSDSGTGVIARCFNDPNQPTQDVGGNIAIINTIVLPGSNGDSLFADGRNCYSNFLPVISASSSSYDPFRVHVTAGATFNTGAANVGPATLSADGIHELAGSKSIDAGTVDALSPIDIDGEARVQGGAVDIGADEFVPPPPPVVTPPPPPAATPIPPPIQPTILNIPAIPPGLSGLTATGTKSTSKIPPIIHFTLSAAQTLRFRIAILLPGRIRKGHCISPAGKKGVRCVSVRPILSGTIDAARGHNDVGLLTSGSRQLSPGQYRVTLVPPGQRARSTEFHVKR